VTSVAPGIVAGPAIQTMGAGGRLSGPRRRERQLSLFPSSPLSAKDWAFGDVPKRMDGVETGAVPLRHATAKMGGFDFRKRPRTNRRGAPTRPKRAGAGPNPPAFGHLVHKKNLFRARPGGPGSHCGCVWPRKRGFVRGFEPPRFGGPSPGRHRARLQSKTISSRPRGLKHRVNVGCGRD